MMVFVIRVTARQRALHVVNNAELFENPNKYFVCRRARKLCRTQTISMIVHINNIVIAYYTTDRDENHLQKNAKSGLSVRAYIF